jgi:hypothetical protein
VSGRGVVDIESGVGVRCLPVEDTHRFDGDYEFEKIYEEELPQVRREDVYAHFTDRVGGERQQIIGWRDALVTEDDRVAGDVSASEDYYNVIQYGDILEAVHRRIEEHGVEPYGRVSLSGSAHRMSAPVYMNGEEARVEAAPDDPINMGVKVSAGHSGYMGVHYDVGAERQVCSNGMTRFVSDLHLDQDHGSPFQPGLAYQAVDGVLQSTDYVEERLEKAQERTLSNLDEARLILHDIGVDQVAENPEADIMNALFDEVEDRDSPSLYEVYQAGTRVVDHYQDDDTPDHYRDTVRDNVARLLDVDGGIPESEELASTVIEDRLNHFVEEGDEAEPYFSDERETLRELAESHGLA